MICKSGNTSNMDKPCVYAIIQRDFYDETNIVTCITCTLIDGDPEVVCDAEIKRDRINCNMYEPIAVKTKKIKKERKEKNVKINK